MKQSGSEAHTPICITGSDQEFQRFTKILMLEVEMLKPLGMSAQFSAALLGKNNVIGGMGPARCRLLAACGELLEMERPS